MIAFLCHVSFAIKKLHTKTRDQILSAFTVCLPTNSVCQVVLVTVTNKQQQNVMAVNVLVTKGK